MALRKLTFEQAKNMPCSIPLSVFEDDRNYDGLRKLLEEDGLIPQGQTVAGKVKTSDLASQIANQRAGGSQKKSGNDHRQDMMTGFLGGKKQGK